MNTMTIGCVFRSSLVSMSDNTYVPPITITICIIYIGISKINMFISPDSEEGVYYKYSKYLRV